jgi:hypothetical protein
VYYNKWHSVVHTSAAMVPILEQLLSTAEIIREVQI